MFVEGFTTQDEFLKLKETPTLFRVAKRLHSKYSMKFGGMLRTRPSDVRMLMCTSDGMPAAVITHLIDARNKSGDPATKIVFTSDMKYMRRLRNVEGTFEGSPQHVMNMLSKHDFDSYLASRIPQKLTIDLVVRETSVFQREINKMAFKSYEIDTDLYTKILRHYLGEPVILTGEEQNTLDKQKLRLKNIDEAIVSSKQTASKILGVDRYFYCIYYNGVDKPYYVVFKGSAEKKDDAFTVNTTSSVACCRDLSELRDTPLEDAFIKALMFRSHYHNMNTASTASAPLLTFPDGVGTDRIYSEFGAYVGRWSSSLTTTSVAITA